jgi:hypothetical protein
MFQLYILFIQNNIDNVEFTFEIIMNCEACDFHKQNIYERDRQTERLF